MKYKAWVMTGVVGSEVYDEIELDDDLTKDEIEEAVFEEIIQLIEWGYEKIDDEKDDWEDEEE